MFVYLLKIRNLASSREDLNAHAVPTGVAAAAYRESRGDDDKAAYSQPGLAFAVCAEEGHASPPMGGVPPGRVVSCPRCNNLSSTKTAFSLFISLQPALGVEYPHPSWQVCPFHLPLSMELYPTTVEDEGERRATQTKRLCEVAMEWRDMNPGAHQAHDHGLIDVEWALSENPETEEGKADRLARLAAVGFDWPHLRGFAGR